MSKPLAIDLCCGLGGWTIGLQEAGFHVIGFDIKHWKGYPGELVIQDIRTLCGEQFKKAKLIVGSPPCQEFSKNSMRMFYPNPPYPSQGIELFNAVRKIGEESRVPYIIENVRGAEEFVGKAINHLGPFYLWGPGTPGIFPFHIYKVKKGFVIDDIKNGKPRSLGGGRQFTSKSPKRREWSARVAMIPIELAKYVGRCYA